MEHVPDSRTHGQRCSCRREHKTMASCQNPLPWTTSPPEKPMDTTAYGGKGSKGRAANGDRPAGAASYRRASMLQWRA